MFSKKLLSAAVCAVSVFTLNAANPKDYTPPPPMVTPSKTYTPPALIDKDSWTMVVLPDTQSYVKFTRNIGIGDLMFSWIAENVDTLKIQQVLMTGDLVDSNRTMRCYEGGNNQTGWQQWNNISMLFKRLDDVVPYVLSTGNHDYGERGSEDRHSYLDRFFPVGRNNKLRNILQDCGPNAFGQPTLENAAYAFTTPHGQKILIVSLSYDPMDKQIEWAKKMFAKFSDHFGILLTHSYFYANYKKKAKMPKTSISFKDGNSGEDIFKKLVKVSPNVRLVICGHVSWADDWRGCAALMTSKNDAGKTVYEMLFDPQAIGGGFNGNGGDGWIRLLEFSKDMKTIKARTFSPLFAISPSTQHLAWQTSELNEFTIKIED